MRSGSSPRPVALFVFRVDDGSVQHMTGTLDELAGLFVIYGFAFTALFACVGMLYRHARRRADALALDATERAEAAFLAQHSFLFAAVGLVSVLTAVAGVGIRFGGPGWVYFLVGPLCWAHSVWSARRTPQLFAS